MNLVASSFQMIPLYKLYAEDTFLSRPYNQAFEPDLMSLSAQHAQKLTNKSLVQSLLESAVFACLDLQN